MKLLMKIFSIVLIVALGFILAFGFFLSLSDMPDYALNLIDWLMSIIFPIIIIAFGCYAVQVENSSIFVRVILAYLIFGILLSAANCFLPLADINEGLHDVVSGISSFITTSYLYIFAYVLLSMVNPNNVVSKTMKRISIGSLWASIIVQIILFVKSLMVEKLPNVYGNDGFNFSSIDETQEMVVKVILACVIIECFSIVLTYITNFAFNDGVIDVSDVDYYELKKSANAYVNSEFNKTYVDPVIEQERKIDRSASEKGLMNVNNQLGIGSNVGNTTGNIANNSKVLEGFAVPSSTGPVINDAVNQKKES